MKVTITPTRLEGQIRIPSSKSMTHREIIGIGTGSWGEPAYRSKLVSGY